MLGEPAKQPGIASVSSRDFQRDHVMTPECHQTQLGTLAGQGQGRAHTHKPKASPKVGIVLQGENKVREGHLEMETLNLQALRHFQNLVVGVVEMGQNTRLV